MQTGNTALANELVALALTDLERATSLINGIQNTGLTFDIPKSLLSPFNIDMSAVSGNSPAEVRFNAIYNKIITSPSFKELFLDIFQSSEKLSVRFLIDNIPPELPGQISYGVCKIAPTSTSNMFKNEITIDRVSLLRDPDDIIATTIIHECIHAFLNVKLKHPSVGMSILDINDLKFDDCVNEYFDRFNGIQDQHDFFVNHITPSIVSILTEIKDLLYTSAQINKTTHPELPGGVAIYIPTATAPYGPSAMTTPWNWNDYFTHLSHFGLGNCDSFNQIYPLNSVARYNYTQYIVAGGVMFEP